MNGDSFDDDDFGDFGGFEEADPVEQQEAQPLDMPDPRQWAVFPGSSMAPDLIQARPSSHPNTPRDVLITPQEDILGARSGAAGGVPSHNGGVDYGFAPPSEDLSIEDFLQVQQQQQHHVPRVSPLGVPDLGQGSGLNLSHNIVAVGPDISQPMPISKPSSSVPDVRQTGSPAQPPDIAQGQVNQNPMVFAKPVVPTVEQNYGFPGALDLDMELSDEDNQAKDAESGISLDIDSPELTNGELYNNLSRQASNRKPSNSDNKSVMNEQLHLVEKERIRLEMELNDVLTQQTRLEEVLLRCQEDLHEQKKKYQQVQDKHMEELDNLRQAGHDTLAIVVEEYKELSKVSVLEQLEVNKRHLKSALNDQMDVCKEIIKDQEVCLKKNLEVEKSNLEVYLKNIMEEQTNKHMEELRSCIETEREKSKLAISRALEEEREKSRKAIEIAVAEEREKTLAFINDEQDKLQKELEKERQLSAACVVKTVKEETIKCKSSIQEAMEDERLRCKDLLTEIKTEGREQFNQYIQEHRQNDASSRLRMLATTDLFLESARKQIDLLLTNPDTLSPPVRQHQAIADRPTPQSQGGDNVNL